MIVNKEDTQTIHEISLLCGVNEDDIESVFEAFLTQFVIKYSNNKRIHIPYIGNFLVKYRQDEETPKGREAQIDAFYAAHDEVKRLVGQLKDIEKTGNYTELDVFTNLKKIVKNDFKTVIEA
jgi:nucleoid DNA-binding protein